MYCKNCGNPYDENDNFCNKCGTDLRTDDYIENTTEQDLAQFIESDTNNALTTEQPEVPDVVTEHLNFSDMPFNHKFSFGVALLFICVIVAIIVFYMFFPSLFQNMSF